MLNVSTHKTPRRRNLKRKYYKNIKILDNRDTPPRFGVIAQSGC